MEQSTFATGMNINHDVYFNELSMQPFCVEEEMHVRIQNFAKVLKQCCQLGFKKVRYEEAFSSIMVSDEQSLENYCCKFQKNPKLNTAIGLLLSTQRRPYIEPGSPQENDFLLNDYKIIVGGTAVEGYGMTSAYLAKAFSVGFASSEVWKDCCFSIRCNNIREDEKEDMVFCITRISHFDEDVFVTWFVEHFIVLYDKRTIEPFCHLRDDHGKNELEAFARKIMKEDFVIEIVNSLPFNSKSSKFIERTDVKSGIIELRLTDTDCGLGIAVRTVAKNKIQIAYFAKLLNDKYHR